MKLDWSLHSVEVDTAIDLAENLARPFESLRLRVYYDPVAIDKWGRKAGYPTQGWGHLHIKRTKVKLMLDEGLDPNSRDDSQQMDVILLERYPDIDRATADRWLRNDIGIADKAVQRLCPVPLTPEQRAALIDFAFNLGAGYLELSTIRKMILRGDMADVADQFLRWNKANGVVLAGLTRRCIARRELWLSGTH